jgi:hypothetical protein
MDAITGHIHRAAEINADVATASNVRQLVTIMSKIDLPHLRSLQLSCDELIAQGLEFTVTAPKLTRIQLYNATSLFPNAVCEQLQYLSINCSKDGEEGFFATLFRMLPHCYRLKSLSIRANGHTLEGMRLPAQVTLSSLEHIQLELPAATAVTKLLQTLEFPTSCSLEIGKFFRGQPIWAEGASGLAKCCSAHQILDKTPIFEISLSEEKNEIRIKGGSQGFTSYRTLPDPDVQIDLDIELAPNAHVAFGLVVDALLPLATIRQLKLKGWHTALDTNDWVRLFSRLSNLAHLDVEDHGMKSKHQEKTKVEEIELLEALASVPRELQPMLCPSLTTLRIETLDMNRRTAKLLVKICQLHHDSGTPLTHFWIRQRSREKSHTLESASALVTNFEYVVL